MPELLILGTSAGVSTANRHHFSMAIKKDGRLYVIDCGCPVSMLLKKMGEDPKNIEAVFLTHWHPDHASGLPMLLQDLQLTHRSEHLPVYGPEGTIRKVKLLQNIFIIPQDIYPYQLEAVEYNEDTLFERDGLKINFFKTKHLAQDAWRKIDDKHGNEIAPVAYGLVIHIDNKKIVVSGDVLSSQDLVHVLHDADLVIHEFGHIHPEKLNHFLKEQQISNLLITHIHHEWDLKTEELQRIVGAGHPGEVQVAHDLMRIIL
ncbi:MBL fold metallo-hydrolase [Paenibacillus sepulcri]|uniref:MBL fold metallo-hydrolase n=1 Tax=Paenibacillus sepulcri TaxID=359917 RepID=A0ABS7C7S9_9BACL|nr:MBL fold metallo-hydrolase [Paenibacillus sepulcri]